jgi:hypothetical protein
MISRRNVIKLTAVRVPLSLHENAALYLAQRLPKENGQYKITELPVTRT